MPPQRCEHGSYRPHDCEACRWARYGDDDYRHAPAARLVPMPDWFRAMLADWRAGGPLTIPPDRLRGSSHDDHERPRYYG